MLLLDTAVLLWAVSRSERLGTTARRRIELAPTVHFSSVSIAEITIKRMLGKIVLDDGLDLPQALADQGFAELALTAAQASAIGGFPELARHDPFDRLLVAQAQTSGIDFLTSDRTLLGLGRPFIVDATA